MLPGKLEYQNSYRGELGGKLWFMYLIQIIESTMGSTSLMVDICDNILVLIQALIHLEAVTLEWKQAFFISCLFDVFHSIDSCMSMLHVY